MMLHFPPSERKLELELGARAAAAPAWTTRCEAEGGVPGARPCFTDGASEACREHSALRPLLSWRRHLRHRQSQGGPASHLHRGPDRLAVSLSGRDKTLDWPSP